MRNRRLRFVPLSVALSIPATIPAQRAATTPCVRPPAQQLADGATIPLTETTRFPCTLQFANSAITLRADSGGATEEIGSSVARGPDGRFYTSMTRSGKVSVWSPTGTWMRNFGALGQGPGEFARGEKYILFDKTGRLFIGDNNRRWSIFSPTYEFVATIPATATGVGASSTAALLDDGNLLSSFGSGGAPLRIYDLNQTAAPLPPVVRSFGAVTPEWRVGRISHSGGSTFWTGPRDGAGLGYVLQLWRTDGTLVRTLRRDVPWVPTGDAATLRSGLPPPEMEFMHEDGTGLIFVMMMTVNKTFLDLTPADRRNESPDGPANKAIDIYFEVIDGNAGVVLASTGPIHPSEAMKLLPLGFIRGTGLAYRREEDANGFPIMRILEAQLTAR